MKNRFIAILAVFATLFVANTTFAVKPVYIEHQSEEQFKEGDPNGVMIRSDGEISLGYEVAKLLSDKKDAWAVNALAQGPDGSVYVATSGKGYIYQLRQDEEPAIIYGQNDDDQKHVFSLAFDSQGRLLAGTGGAAGVLMRYDKSGKWKTLYKNDEIKYIWKIVLGPAGRVYLATGPTGKVMTMTADGKDAEVIYDAKVSNIMALALSVDGIVYAGGDEEGLIYRIDPGTKKATIAYDSDHNEISALLFDNDGNLYASTADVGAARPGAKLILADGNSGRSEKTDEKKTPEKSVSDDKIDSKDDQSEGVAEVSDEDKERSDSAENGEKVKTVVVPKQAGSEEKPNRESSRPSGRSGSKSGRDRGGDGDGKNEVIMIAASGYARSLFSNSVVILDMVWSSDGGLLLATGNDGRMLRLDPISREAVVMHCIDGVVQVSALLTGADGTVYVGCANPGMVWSVARRFVSQGYYDSSVIDAKQVSLWGKMHVEAAMPAGTRVTLSTRTGNTSDAEQGGWSRWTDAVAAGENVAVGSPAGRFMQYRLTLHRGDERVGPVVRKVALTSMIPNLPPKVESVEVGQGGKDDRSRKGSESGDKTWPMKWSATDENGDELRYDVYLRQVGHDRWVRIAEELSEAGFGWDTQTVADGRYEIKVEACDALSNASKSGLADSRISRVVVVDNTPPMVPVLTMTAGNGVIRVRAEVVDELSAIKAVGYRVNSDKDWSMVGAVDGIYDSREEVVEFEFEKEDDEAQLLAVYFEDASGNRRYVHREE